MAWLSVRETCILGALFFGICLGLGFSSLERYDPRGVRGLRDTQSYVAMVRGESSTIQPVHRLRILLPALSRPIAKIAQGRIGGWSPEFLGLLVINSMFMSFAALILLRIAGSVSGNRATGIVAALLYLLSFNVSSFYLAGLVDSVEAWAVIAAAWLMLSGRWKLIPLVGFIAALGKETTIPLLFVFCVVWLFEKRASLRVSTAALISALLMVAQISAILLACWIIGEPFRIPWHLMALANAGSTDSGARIATLFNREWIYSFLWLLPLGLLRLRLLPREWTMASVCSFVTAMALGLMLGVRGNVVRPSFNAIGPILIVACSIYLVDVLGPRYGPTPNRPSPDLS